jgi:hypothetical protein
MVAPAAGTKPGVTTTPQEPSSDPELVPSGDPELVPSGDQPLGPIEVPDGEQDPEQNPVPDSARNVG